MNTQHHLPQLNAEGARWGFSVGRLAVIVAVLGVFLSFWQEPQGPVPPRWRTLALRSIVDASSYSTLGDPMPTIVAAQRLRDDPRAVLYEPSQTVGSRFIYPPLAAAWYSPFATSDPLVGQEWLRIVNRVALLLLLSQCFFLYTSAGGDSGVRGLVFTIGVLGLFYPLHRAVELNQSTVLVCALVGFCWCFLVARRVRLAGAVFALALGIKPQMVIALLVMAPASPAFVLSALITGILQLGVSLAYAGWENHILYVRDILPTFASGYVFWPNQSFNGLANRWVFQHDLLAFAVAPSHTGVRLFTLATTAILVLITVAASWRARSLVADRRLPWLFALAWLTSTMVSPVAWEHHYAPAIFLWCWLGGIWSAREHPSNMLLLLLIPGFVAMASFLLFVDRQGPIARLIVSYVFFGALLVELALLLGLTKLCWPRQKSCNIPTGTD